MMKKIHLVFSTIALVILGYKDSQKKLAELIKNQKTYYCQHWPNKRSLGYGG